MKSILAVSTLALLLAPPATRAQQTPATSAKASGPCQLAQTWHVAGEGGWDYVTVDTVGERVFLPRVTHTLVLDITSGRTVADIPGQIHNHGVALTPDADRGFISDGGDGSVVIFETQSYAVLGRIPAVPDADGIIYDPASNKILVACGDSGVLVPIAPDVDPVHGRSGPAVPLGGKPEFLVADGSGHVYVNLVDQDAVAVVDTKTMKVVHRWSTAPGGAPVGLAMDRTYRRLFIGCRRPQKLVVMNADDGTVLADFPIGAGVDATAFDAGCAYASCGDGTLAVVRELFPPKPVPGKFSPEKYALVQDLPTARGARTMGVDAQTRRLFLPTADFAAATGPQRRPAMVPGTFKVLVLARTDI